jgi:hypothetical protein
MNESLSDQLLSIAGQLGLEASHFTRVSRDADGHLREIKRHFVERPGCRWWWECFRTNNVVTSVRFADGQGFRRLVAIVPDATVTAWFVVEDDSVQNGFALFEAQTTAIERVISECSCFEYYIVSKRLTWLVGENHHDVVFAVGTPVANRLSRLVENISEQVNKTSPG